MTDLKSLLAASALALVIGTAAPAIAGEHKAEDGKKMEKREHKDGDHSRFRTQAHEAVGRR